MGFTAASVPVTEHFLWSRSGIVTVGAPTAVNTGSRFPAYRFRDANTDQVSLVFDDDVLSKWGWSNFSVDVWYAGDGSASGNLNLSLTTSLAGEGDNPASGDTTLYQSDGTGNQLTVPANGLVHKVTLATTVAVTAAKLRHFRLNRLGADAIDTYGGAWDFLGLRLGKV